MIEVKLFPRKGKGIVATKQISKGTVIEVAPVVSFPAEQRKLIDGTEVRKYYFVIPSEYEKSKNVEGYIVFGLSSLCNHSEVPNAYINWVKDDIGLWAYLTASKNINPRDEICIFYTNINEYSLKHKFI